ncbi:MAG: ABC transporter substrate-binding protein [Beijerinckiaceae bacterium]|nr:ABC transporter substrate-binding protein [Beijerinckiaceae bacterium]
MKMFARRTALALSLCAPFALAGVGQAQAQAAAPAPTPIKMIGFGGATNIPVWVALDKGFFAKEGLAVTLDRTAGSKEQIADIMSGKYQFATSAFDNIVAYTDGQGATKFDDFDIVAVLGVHSGLNSVLVRPEIKTYADLKGKTVAVDAVASGYATVLYQILKNKGLEKDKDYKIISVGGTEGRVKALKDGTAQVAIISSPQDKDLEKEGFKILDDAAAAIGDYQGSAYVVRKSWAKAHEKEMMALVRAVIAAQNYVFDNKAGAIEVLKARTKGLTDAEADALYQRLTGPGGLSRNAELNPKGVEMVLKLRSVYGNASPSSPAKYIDTSYQDRVRGK